MMNLVNAIVITDQFSEVIVRDSIIKNNSKCMIE